MNRTACALFGTTAYPTDMQFVRILGFTALVAAEWVRGIGLVAAGALTYGLLGGAMPPEGGLDRAVAIASFVTIALGAADLLFSALFAATALRLRALQLPPDRPVNLQAGWSAALSLLLIVAGNPLAPQITMLALASVAAASLRLIRDERGRNG
ncbi:MAG: hypothetical protein RL578_697 [Chloroflexota bacterium]